MKKSYFILLMIICIIVVFFMLKITLSQSTSLKESLKMGDSIFYQKKGSTYHGKILSGKTIIIDPGHGGKDIGSTGQNGTLEKDITLVTAKEIEKELLEKTGATVFLTREMDQTVSLQKRVEMGEKAKADFFLSVHYDAFFTHDVKGITCYYYKWKDKWAAKRMNEYLFNSGIKTRDRGVEKGDYYVLRENKKPSVLLELGYISNEEDEELMNSQFFQQQVAKAAVEAIIDYLGK